MERNDEMLSLADALRDGVSLETIRESFENALQAARDEIVKEQEAKAKAEKCGCTHDSADTLEDAREDMVIAVIDYLTALGILPGDLEITDEDVDHLIDGIKEIEEEFKARIGLMQLMTMVIKPKKDKTSKKETADESSIDDAIARFLKSL